MRDPEFSKDPFTTPSANCIVHEERAHDWSASYRNSHSQISCSPPGTPQSRKMSDKHARVLTTCQATSLRKWRKLKRTYTTIVLLIEPFVGDVLVGVAVVVCWNSLFMPDRTDTSGTYERNWIKREFPIKPGQPRNVALNIFFSFPRFHSPPPTPNLSEIYCKEVGQRTGRKIFDLQRLSPIFWWNRTETDLSIWLSTEISGILCWHTMKSTGSLHTDSVLINKSPQNWKTVVLSANYASIVLNSGYLWKGWILQS